MTSDDNSVGEGPVAGASADGQERSEDPITTPTVVSMRALHRSDLTSYLTAKIDHQGHLRLDGQDLMSGGADHPMRSDEYEYTKTYDSSTFPAILEALGEPPGSEIMSVIAAHWCGDERAFEFEQLLTAAEIPHDIWIQD